MAFMGVILGMLAKVAASKECLLVLMRAQWTVKWGYRSCNYTACWAFGLMLSSYFQLSSLLDSCLMAASGNIVTDI
jgi:hypothetical protein